MRAAHTTTTEEGSRATPASSQRRVAAIRSGTAAWAPPPGSRGGRCSFAVQIVICCTIRLLRSYLVQGMSLLFQYIHIKKISFTLYPAHSRVGRGNLVLRHSVPHCLPDSGGIAC